MRGGGRGSRARRRVRRVRASPGRGVGILRCPFEGSRWVYDPPTRLRSAMPRPASPLNPEESDRQKRDCDSRPRLTSATSTSSSSPRRTADALAKGFGPYDHEHVKAAIIIQRLYRGWAIRHDIATALEEQDPVRACSWCARAGPSSSRTSGSARSTRTSRKGTTR